jgi:glutamate dehydrogenase
VLAAARAGQAITELAAVYFAVAERFRIREISEAARAIPVTDYYDRLALDRMRDSIDDAVRRIAMTIAAEGHGGGEAVAAWAASRASQIERISGAIQDITAAGLTLSKLTVAASLLGDLGAS